MPSTHVPAPAHQAFGPIGGRSRALRSPALVVAILTTLSIWFVWAAVNPLPLVHDEHSYVLQSRIFATGHWTAPSPPMPEFFQQPHVLTVPAVASKYPPGHALLMSLGSLFGAPALVPLLLTGLTGALLFLLVRRVATERVALVAWIIWLGDPINLQFRPAYYSEVTSQAMLLLAWWTLLRWRESGERRWLLGLAAAIGWGAITRPLTMLACAVPIGVVVVRDVIRRKTWADLAAALALGTLVLGVLPLWSAETTGSWRVTPQALWTREYMPYDAPGFGAARTPPTRPLLADDREVYLTMYPPHADHTLAHLPRIAFERLAAVARAEWGGPRILLVPFVLIGLTAMNAAVTFALVSAAALFVAYMSYGYWAYWTLYDFEALPVLAVLAAFGCWRAFAWLREHNLDAEHGRRWRRVGAAAAVALVVLTGYELLRRRAARVQMARYDVAFQRLVATLPVRAAVIFVHYAPRVAPHTTVVTNSPHLADDSIWIVNDLGARDTALMRVAGDRVPFAFYEDGARIAVDRGLRRAAARR